MTPDGSSREWPRISIVTPSFNQAAFLEECIRSVLDQGYPDLQYVIVDGGSTDGSLEVIRRYEHRLDHWESEPDRGQAHALNKGFARCDGEVFGFLNSDDVLCPGTLARVAERYLAHPDPERFWVAFSVEDFDESGTLKTTGPKPHHRLADWIDYKAYLHQPGSFWSSWLHREVGGFDEELQYAFDRKFFMAAMLEGARLDADPGFVAARFRHHPDSKTNQVGKVEDLGFAPEFIRISRWAESRASRTQRVRIAYDRLMRPLRPGISRLRMLLGAVRRGQLALRPDTRP